MKNVKLTLEYDGTAYYGWQKQENLKTVEGMLQKAIKKSIGEEVKILASGRTDAGVHAYGQVANFLTNSTVPGDRFKYAVNDKLPDDISIRMSEEVPLDFHSRFSAKRKTYEYVIYPNDTRSSLMRNYSYHVTYKLDTDLMKEALGYFVGRKDFTSLTPYRSNENKNIRTLYDTDLFMDGELIKIRVSGNGFLHNMVRIIVGTVIEVGYGKRKLEDINKILELKDRKFAGHTAPAQGLYLIDVKY